MTKLEKRFLNCCIKYYLECSVISSDDLLKYIDVPLISLQRCAQRLEQNGYIKNLHIQMRIRFNFQLTYEGSFYSEIRSDRIKDFLLKSVLIPIVISVIASLAVASISYLWSMRSISQNSQTPIPQPTNELTMDTMPYVISESSESVIKSYM